MVTAVLAAVAACRADPGRPDATPSPDSAVTREANEGKASDGLRCSLAADRDVVPMGATVALTLSLGFDPSGVDPKTNLLNQCPQDGHVAFTLTDTRSGKVFQRAPQEPGLPPPPVQPEDVVRLRLEADVEVFATSVSPGHPWAPRRGDYEVLWKGKIGSRPARRGRGPHGPIVPGEPAQRSPQAALWI